MTLLSKLLLFFPTLVLVLTGISLVWIAPMSSILGAISALFSLYGFPLICYRWHQWQYPVPEGISYPSDRVYSPWWGSHQLQAIYIAIPLLEAVLRLIPGAFSLWLRLWGAKIGRNVYWTPGLEIADRGLLEIGDGAVIGHRVGIYAHIIKPRRQRLMMYVKRVKIGNDTFIGAGSHLSPGVIIHDGTYLAAGTNLYPNQHQ